MTIRSEKAFQSSASYNLHTAEYQITVLGWLEYDNMAQFVL